MLKLEHISKTYPGVVALYDVSLEYEQGEVHALLGENGAGKSTLIKIIAGAIEPDAGGIIDFDGKKFTHMTPALSAQNGVAVIYQDINLVTPMTVAENIFMGRKMGKVYSKRRLNALARELFAEYGFDMDPSMKVSRLSPANQQLVEIARAISNNAKIMIMDEPTAPLAAHEVELLFSIISALAEKYRGELRIKVPGVKQMVVNLSGGNQQKVALAKALAADPDIIIFDEPTKGIDVGAKQEIYQLMNDLVESGKAIIMVLLETTLPFWVVRPVCIVLGFLMGTLNGLIASKLKLFPLVVTIATSEVFKGIAYTITSSKSYSGMPDTFRALYKTKLLGLPLDVYLAILVVAATWIVLNKTHFGRDVLAVGGNKECARLSGIRSDLVQTLCFALTGAIFAIATLDMLAQQNQTSATTGPGTEITCLTAAIIGGISMMGGKGNVVGMVAGIFVMQMIANGMQLAGWGTYTQYIVKGVILLLAIGFDAIKNYPKPVVRIHKDKVGAGKAS